MESASSGKRPVHILTDFAKAADPFVSHFENIDERGLSQSIQALESSRFFAPKPTTYEEWKLTERLPLDDQGLPRPGFQHAKAAEDLNVCRSIPPRFWVC
jgi:hypothetical protein